MYARPLGSTHSEGGFPPSAKHLPTPNFQAPDTQEPCGLTTHDPSMLLNADTGLVPQTSPTSPALPEMQSLRLLIEELNSRVLLGNLPAWSRRRAR